MSTNANSPAMEQAFAEYDQRVSISNSKVGCVLASILMPLGSISMDLVVYPGRMGDFFGLRMLSAVLTLAIFGLFYSAWGQRQYRVLRVAWYWVPMAFILLMIHATNNAQSPYFPLSPYYAGLNLVLIGAGVVLPWTYKDILLTSVSVLALYVVVFLGGSGWDPILANNLFFLSCTAIVVVTGSYFHSRLRFREFTLRFELEQNRKIIEENNRKLVELDQAKSRFFANISHELRTPLTLLLAPLDTLRGRYAAMLGNEGEELITMMRDNGMRLLKLINDLLDLVRLEEGRVKIERSALDLASFVRGLTSSVQHTAATREVRLSVEVQEGIPMVLLDRDKLEKTLLNLLFNALKFTNAGGQVVLTVTRAAEELVFRVSDTGIGISQDDLRQLFQRFWQADASSHRKQQGAGIGLSLVKEFTEAQGGTVHVESELGRGTTFTVRLPFVTPELGEGPTGVETQPGPHAVSAGQEGDSWLQSLYREAQLSPAVGDRLTGRTALYARDGEKVSTVLVADDEPDMLRFIRAQLGAEHRVVSAVNGREAVERATEARPDVIVLDMMMPEMDGIEACRVLRENPATAQIPIIMLTARADEETKLAALAAGANDFIAKPFSVTELHVRVRNLIDGHFSRVELAKQNRALEDTLEILQETEMQLLHSEKLASIGELSAGMSHEVKNPLNYALTGVYALRNRAASLPEAERADFEDLVATVEEGVRRVMETVNTLRELVHPQVENRQEFQIQEVAEAALRLLRSEWKGRVVVHTHIAANSVLCANKSMILLVFLNLLKNAMDALGEGATSHGEPAIWIEGEESEGRVIVRVRDNGPGISRENQSKVFDILGMGDFSQATPPAESAGDGKVLKHFFSTKAPGVGMGMGLSICRRIVRAHGGKISFHSEPGTMCEFLLELPSRKVVEEMA